MRSAERLTELVEIENRILDIGLEFDDAANIVACILSSLKRKYPSYAMWDIEHYGEYFLKSLDRGPMMLQSEVDEMALAKEEK